MIAVQKFNEEVKYVDCTVAVNTIVKNSKKWEDGEVVDKDEDEDDDLKGKKLVLEKKIKKNKTPSTMTKAEFMSLASPIKGFTLFDKKKTLKLVPKRFKTGSVGWFCVD